MSLREPSVRPAGFNDPIPGTACSGATNIQRVQEITAGLCYNVYKGDLGRVRVGIQYEYWHAQRFRHEPDARARRSSRGHHWPRYDYHYAKRGSQSQ